jgi:parallel beta-helix repeat protein
VEGLEDRVVPAVFTVNTLADTPAVDLTTGLDSAGNISLRSALQAANATPGADTITFALPDSLKGPNDWWTIQPLSDLPIVTDPATLDGWSQAGAGPGLAPKVMLDGTFSGLANGLHLSGNSTVRGLAVGNFTGGKAGILLDGGGNTVQGCYVGLDPSGTTAAPNNDGVSDDAYTNVPVGNTIGGANPAEGNVISGNDLDVRSRGYGVTIRGNIIGLNAAGTAALSDNSATLLIGETPSDNYTSVIAGNVISGSRADGIQAGGVNHVRITGNLIGTDITGAHAIPNAHDGIEVGGGNGSGGTSDVLIGGTDLGSRNVIAASGGKGISIHNGTAEIRVQGNYIGTPASGVVTPGFGNGSGIEAFEGTLIGGSEPGAGNLIAGNLGAGVGSRGSNNLFIGNVIHDNGDVGVVFDFTAEGNTVSMNSIYGNGGIGIDLEPMVGGNPVGGVTLNDSAGHDGPNHLQNFPVLTSVFSSGTSTSISGTFDEAAEPNTAIRLEFFSSPQADPTGYGEGQTYLGWAQVTTDANGHAAFSAADEHAASTGPPVGSTPAPRGKRCSRPPPPTSQPATPRSSRRTSRTTPPRSPTPAVPTASTKGALCHWTLLPPPIRMVMLSPTRGRSTGSSLRSAASNRLSPGSSYRPWASPTRAVPSPSRSV